MGLHGLIAANLFLVDSRLYGESLATSARVDSRFRGNDGNRRLERGYSLDVPCATAGTDPLALAGLCGNHGTWRGISSLPPL